MNTGLVQAHHVFEKCTGAQAHINIMSCAVGCRTQAIGLLPAAPEEQT